MVLYEHVYPYGEQLFVRPKTMFYEMVDIDGKEVYRFRELNKD